MDERSFTSICALVEDLRSRHAQPRQTIDWTALAEEVEGRLHPFRRFAIVESFIEDCARARFSQPDFSATRASAASSDDPVVVGYFSAPYNPSLTLECLAFRYSPVDATVSERFPGSRAAPISVYAHTWGFTSPLSVALFPENFVASHPPSECDRTYYFIDRFVARFERITMPLLGLVTDPDLFATLGAADVSALLKASTTWVYLHEYFHRTGPLPLPDYLPKKSTISTAAMEEIRVDMRAIGALAELHVSGYRDARTAIQFILAERLIRYPLEADPQENYDARGSQFLLGYFLANGVLRSDGGGLVPTVAFPALLDACRLLAELIETTESQLRAAPETEADPRTRLIRRFAGYNKKAGRFELSEFHRRARQVADGATAREAWA